MIRSSSETRLREWVVFAGVLGLTVCMCVASASAAPQTGCEQTAQLMQKSCTQESRADFLLALAKAANLPTMMERSEAIDEAREELEEAREECSEQKEARLDLCDLLGEDFYHPDTDPANFDAPVANPYFPLTPGVTRTYEGETEDGIETVVVIVTDETREIDGVECTVVLDIGYLDGEPVEETLDYFAYDNLGNAWYFGEDSFEIEDGLISSTDGSWIAGEDGAKPGIVMPATPTVGITDRQEMLLGEAEDAATVISVDDEVSVPYGDFVNVVQTMDFTPIEPEGFEYKFHAAGVGTIKEVDSESGEELVLISVEVE